MTKVILKRGEEKRILNRDPWVFSNEVLKIKGMFDNGDLVEVTTHDDQFVGIGYINLKSKIIVRILSYDRVDIDESFFFERIQTAKNAREALGYQDNYRVVFSESDQLPGLVVDKYHDLLSIQTLTLGMDIRKDMIVNILVKLFSPRGIYERNDVPVRKKEGLAMIKGPVYQTFDPVTTINENGVLMQVDVENGQKTGYFLDQKDNRKALATYVKGQRVLDCFSHTGGFALHAAHYGAQSVTAVDISQIACDVIASNALLNGFDHLHAVKADVFDYLRENTEAFDVIVLDPPAFTKSADTIQKAYAGYKEINLSAMKRLPKNGILMTCSCSQHMTPALFFEMLSDAASDAKRHIQMLEFRIQSKDHPTLLVSSEAMYLKCVVLRVM